LAALLHGTLVVGISQTAALNRGRHLYSAGRPPRWALAQISSFSCILRQKQHHLNYLYLSLTICIHRILKTSH